MSSGHDATSSGDAGYDSLLARFQRQPVRPPLTVAKEQPKLKERPSRGTGRTVLDQLPASAAHRAAAQLRAVWSLHTAENLGLAHHKSLLAEAEGIDAGMNWKEVYLVWRDACRKKFLSPLMCVEVVCLGIEDSDARYKMRPGTAKENMMMCLDLYCSQRGWSEAAK